MSKPRRKTTIQLSNPSMRIEFIPGGYLPELSLIHDTGTERFIGLLSDRNKLKELKEALKDV